MSFSLRLLFDPGDESIIHKTGDLLPDYTTSHPKRALFSVMHNVSWLDHVLHKFSHKETVVDFKFLCKDYRIPANSDRGRVLCDSYFMLVCWNSN